MLVSVKDFTVYSLRNGKALKLAASGLTNKNRTANKTLEKYTVAVLHTQGESK